MAQAEAALKPADSRFSSFDRVRDESLLAKCLQLHTFVNLIRSALRPLAKSDMFNLPEDLQPEVNVSRYNQNRGKSDSEFRRRKSKHVSPIEKALKRLVRRQLLIGASFAMVGVCLSLAGPLVIKQIIAFLRMSRPSNEQESTVYWQVGLWIGMFLLRIFVNEAAERLIFFQAVKMEEVLSIELLHKITRLSPSYRHRLEKGQLLNYMTVDVKLVFDFLKSCTFLFSAPTTIIGVQLFLFRQVGADGLILSVIIVVVGIIHSHLNAAMSLATNQKLTILKSRMKFNVEAFSAIREVKTMGWQDVVVEKNRAYRQQENAKNSEYFTYANIYDSTLNLIPAVTVLIIFFLQSITSSKSQLDPACIYAVLSFVGMTYGPSKSLLSIMVSFKNAMDSFKRLTTFLKEAEEISELDYSDPSMPQGAIQLEDGLTANWSLDAAAGADAPHKQHNSVRADESQSIDQEVKSLASCRSETSVRLGNYALRVSPALNISPGQRYFVMGGSDSGKTSLLQTIMGNVNILFGRVRYSGKVGYLPAKTWFKRASVRQNILFGLPEDKEKLRRVYRAVMMQQELKFLPKGDDTIMRDVNNITESQKKRIALARVLYSDPGILLLDSPFSSIDTITALRVYENLCRQYASKTMLIVENDTSLFRPTDYVIIMRNGSLTEKGTYGSLLADPSSGIHQLTVQDNRKATEKEIQNRRILLEQRLQRQKKLAERHRKLRLFVKQLLLMKKRLGPAKLQQHLEAKTAAVPCTVRNRAEPVPMWMYLKLLGSAPKLLYILLFMMALSSHTLKIFADLQIGSVKSSKEPNSYLLRYALLTALFGVLYSFGGYLMQRVSVANTQYFGHMLAGSLVHTDLGWFEGQNNLKVASRLNRDNVEYFVLNGRILNVFGYFIVFLSTTLLIGSNSPAFYLLAAVVFISEVLILLNYTQLERQIHPFGTEFTDNMGYAFEEAINGVQTFRAFGQLQDVRRRIFQTVYDLEVYRVNSKFAMQGMTILTEFCSLVIISGVAFFALSRSGRKARPEELATIGTAITYALRLTSIMTKIVKDCVQVQVGMKVTVKKAYEVIGKNQQAGYDEPEPPAGWPADYAVQFRNVTLKRDSCSHPLLENASFEISSGSNVAVCGKGGKTAILLAICKMLAPTETEPKGRILIGRVDLEDIGRKHVARRVLMASETPFLFSGTVRQNIDPRGEKSDSEICSCLQQVGLWEHFQSSKHPATHEVLSHVLHDAGSELTLGLQQRFHLARALLVKPSVLLCESCTTSLDERSQKSLQKVLRQQLTATTIITVAPPPEIVVEEDAVIYVSMGRVCEFGSPQQLILNQKSKFSRMIQAADAELYERFASLANNTEREDII